jgi:hypothetical protein
MSRLGNPGCMIRASSALFGAILLPMGAVMLFVSVRLYWAQSLGTIVAAACFFALAARANDILGIDAVPEEPEERPRRGPPTS